MAEAHVAEPVKASEAEAAFPGHGLMAFGLLALVGMWGSEITPRPGYYYLGLDLYIPRYVLLAFSVGVALSAVRSADRRNRVFGIPVLLVGAGVVAYIIVVLLGLIR